MTGTRFTPVNRCGLGEPPSTVSDSVTVYEHFNPFLYAKEALADLRPMCAAWAEPQIDQVPGEPIWVNPLFSSKLKFSKTWTNEHGRVVPTGRAEYLVEYVDEAGSRPLLKQQPHLIDFLCRSFAFRPETFSALKWQQAAITSSAFPLLKLALRRGTDELILVLNHVDLFNISGYALSELSVGQQIRLNQPVPLSVTYAMILNDANRLHIKIQTYDVKDLCRVYFDRNHAPRSYDAQIHDLHRVYLIADVPIVEWTISAICADEVAVAFPRANNNDVMFHWIPERMRQHMETDDEHCVETFRRHGVPDDVIRLIAHRKRHVLPSLKSALLHKRHRSLHRSVDRLARFVSSKPDFSFADLESIPVALDHFEFVWKLLHGNLAFGPLRRIAADAAPMLRCAACNHSSRSISPTIT